MDWWEDGEDDWFEKYLPGQDLPDGLEWTPFRVDLTTNREVTTYMYPGLQNGLQDVITTAGCEDMEVLITHRVVPVDKDAYVPGWEPSIEFLPELGIYPILHSHLDLLVPVAASQVPTDLSLARYAEVDVLVEVRRTTAFPIETASTAFLPSQSPAPDTTSASDGGSYSDFNLGGDEHLLSESVISVFNCQHRLFVFMIFFVEDKARLLRFDRTGVSMTPAFDYTQRPEVIGKFLFRLSRNRAAMGHDPAVTRADETEAGLFRDLHNHYVPESTVARGLADAATDGWPIYKLAIEGRFTPDGENRAVVVHDPVSRREFLVGKPMSAGRSLFSRGTKAHVACDVATQKIVVIKDSWRSNSDNETRTSDPDLPTRTHFRLVLKEVCRRLEDFTNSFELVVVILCAIDAHFVAWSSAGILHRDVSIGDILILDNDPEGPPDLRTAKGLLADWDLARTKNELENPVLNQNTRSGTWPFISARLQHTGPEQRHELSDDLESFVHVLNYCAVKYLPNDLSHEDSSVSLFISSVYDHVRKSGGLEKGSRKKLELLVKNKPFVELENPVEQPLTFLLHALSELCYLHYRHIQFALPPPRYSLGPEKMAIRSREWLTQLSSSTIWAQALAPPVVDHTPVTVTPMRP